MPKWSKLFFLRLNIVSALSSELVVMQFDVRQALARRSLGDKLNDAPESTLDYTGYDFWLTKLNQFNGNYINAEMVKAFLSSIEYRQRFRP